IDHTTQMFMQKILNVWIAEGKEIDEEKFWMEVDYNRQFTHSVEYYEHDEGNDGIDNWYTDTNPGGFIIGNPNGNGDDPENNWAKVDKRYHAFMIGNNKPDHFYVRFLVKIVNQLTVPGNTLLTLHIGSGWHRALDGNNDTTPYEYSITKTGTAVATEIAANSEGDGWGWIEFDVPNIVGSGNHAGDVKVALQWHGIDDGNEGYLGQLKARGISYQSHDSNLIFPDPTDPDELDQDFFDAYLEQVRMDFDRLSPHSVIGISAYEGWKYSWYPSNLLLTQLRNFAGDYAYSGLYPGIPNQTIQQKQTTMEQYLDKTGVDQLIVDGYPIKCRNDDVTGWWWHWEESFDGDDEGIDGISIQDAWDDMNTTYSAARAAAGDRDLWLGIQASCQLETAVVNDVFVGKAKGYGEPTPRMVMCQGYQAMTYAPKAFFYSYYGPVYHTAKNDTGARVYYYVNPVPAHPDRWDTMNGAAISGLVSLHENAFEQPPDYDNPAGTDAEIKNAASWAVGGQSTGWLWPNEKGDKAKTFNDYVHLYSPFIATLDFGDSKCAEDQATIGDVTIDSTWYMDGQNVVTDDEMWVQMGVFAGGNIFMLVNRRCDEDGGRFIDVKVDISPVNDAIVCQYEFFGAEVISEGVGDRKFTVYLGPGEGCLYSFHQQRIESFIDSNMCIRGDFFIEDSVEVTADAMLTILPGSRIIFVDDGSLHVRGQLKALGKYDAAGDSSVSFISLTNPNNGLVSLYSTQTDTFSYCKFSHLETGLKVSKSSSSKVEIDHCEFSYNEDEGLYVSGGEVTVTSSEFRENGGDGLYLYDCKATLDSLTVARNVENGAYCYSISSSSAITNSSFMNNGEDIDSSPESNIRFYNCSPTLKKNEVVAGGEYGLYGANGSYPIMYATGVNAANTITGNHSHETYWDASYPSLSYGHNNFDVEDDTLIYITNSSITSFYAYGNYWGGGAPNTGSPSSSYYGPGTFYYSGYDEEKQTRVHGDESNFDPSFTKGGDDFIIADNEEDALDVFIETFDLEKEEPFNAIDAYRDLIAEFLETSISTMCVDRIMWLIRSNYVENARQRELISLLVYFNRLSRTEENDDLAWKAKRARLWTFAAMNRFDDAISGFEEIVRNPDSFADSVYAVIDIGTIHLEALEWERRDEDGERGDAVIRFGSMPQLCPVDFPTHRVHTDELLAMLGSLDAQGRPTIPTEYFLAQNYPNPFNSMTKIQFGLPEATHVKIRIFDIMGREVITLVDTDMKAGYYTNVWQGRNKGNVTISSGMYFYQIQAGNYIKTRKMILVK
ncbi:MAG: T9SS type A sorting domain-containing protein, partial [Calditrichaeota bacterium]|nr:T9SS type A sorting domain-containing protein [Calditrichota bacterium]